jgi:hypothetical protein
MALPQQPAFDSGLVVGIPITITPMIAAAFLQGPVVVRAAVTGTNSLIIEVAYSWDGLTWDVWPTTIFGGADGNGLPSGFDSNSLPLPDKRPPWIRIRGQAATGTTDAQVQLYELPIWRAQTRGQFIPVT